MPRVVIVGTGFGRRNVAPIFQALGWRTHIVSPPDPAAQRAAIEVYNAADPIGPALSAWLARVSDAVKHPRQIGPDFTDGLACARVLDTLRRKLRRA